MKLSFLIVLVFALAALGFAADVRTKLPVALVALVQDSQEQVRWSQQLAQKRLKEERW